MGPKTIVVIGASTVYGNGDPDLGGFVNRLRRWRETHDPHSKTYALGIFGETTAQILERVLPEAAPRRPGLIVFMLGLNDTMRTGSKTAPPALTPEASRNNIRELIVRAKTLAPVMCVSMFPIDERKTAPIPGTQKFFLPEDAEKTVNMTAEVCRAEHVPFLDIYKPWSAMKKEIFLYRDGLHCNAVGHQKLFEEVRDFINKNFSKK